MTDSIFISVQTRLSQSTRVYDFVGTEASEGHQVRHFLVSCSSVVHVITPFITNREKERVYEDDKIAARTRRKRAAAVAVDAAWVQKEATVPPQVRNGNYFYICMFTDNES